jgi:hypothetical protein
MRPIRTRSSPASIAVVGFVAAAVWVVLAAPQIERSVRGSELGLWRDVRLAIVAPLASVRAVSAAAAPAAAAAPTPIVAAIPIATAGAESTPLPSVTPSVVPERIPTSADPLRVLVVGDSMAGDLGRSLGRVTAPSGLVTVDLDYRPASGLSRPDYFDWRARLAEDVSRSHPDVVVVELGGNDAQSFESGGHVVGQGTDEWRAIYAARVAELMRVASTNGTRVVWIGLPVMAEPVFGDLMRRENEIYEAQARDAGARYLDTWALFAGPDGRYAPYLPDASGHLAPMRQADGIHLSVAGAERLATLVARELAVPLGQN